MSWHTKNLSDSKLYCQVALEPTSPNTRDVFFDLIQLDLHACNIQAYLEERKNFFSEKIPLPPLIEKLRLPFLGSKQN